MAKKVLGLIVKNEVGQTLDRYYKWRDHEKGDQEAYVHAPDALFGEAMLGLTIGPSRVITARYDPDQDITIVMCAKPSPTLYIEMLRAKLIQLQEKNTQLQEEVRWLKETLSIAKLLGRA